MQAIISLTKALEVMQATDRAGNPVPFRLTFWTANEREQTGGEEITYERAVIHMKVRGKSVNVGNAIRNLLRNPHHVANGTLNIRQVGTDRITTTHPWLYKEINGLKIILGTL